MRNDELFNALLVGFGRFGVIYSYVLRVRSAFRLAEWTARIPRTVLTGALRNGIAGGIFLAPLLAMLPAPPPALGALDLVNPVGLEVVFDTNNLAMCWVKRRWATSDPADLNMTASANPLCDIGAGGVLAAGLLVLGAWTAVPVFGAVVGAKMTELSASLAADPASGWRDARQGADGILGPHPGLGDPAAQRGSVRAAVPGVDDHWQARALKRHSVGLTTRRANSPASVRTRSSQSSMRTDRVHRLPGHGYRCRRQSPTGRLHVPALVVKIPSDAEYA